MNQQYGQYPYNQPNLNNSQMNINMSSSNMKNHQLSSTQMNMGNYDKPMPMPNNDLSNSCPNPAS